MNDKELDMFLRAYQSETDQPPSQQILDSILTVPDRITQGSWLLYLRPWHWLDSMMPKVVGWAMTCCLGIYVGLLSPGGGESAMDEEYYLYDQAQVLLFEDMDFDPRETG
ncbi:MAG: hypothetical protein COB49_06545 [Alphaproteobacteria bacterium]|nr:MAG: hypothetical protein COB49_06545 [Alphaproteobacteria bacterium]